MDVSKPVTISLQLDDSPIPTDWVDIHILAEDMRRFARANPGHTFLCADDPGANYSPPRVARLGWTAFLRSEAGDEQVKSWTIKLSDVRKAAGDTIPLVSGNARGRVAALADFVSGASRDEFVTVTVRRSLIERARPRDYATSRLSAVYALADEVLASADARGKGSG